jgi:hypothetical protein
VVAHADPIPHTKSTRHVSKRFMLPSLRFASAEAAAPATKVEPVAWSKPDIRVVGAVPSDRTCGARCGHRLSARASPQRDNPGTLPNRRE